MVQGSQKIPKIVWGKLVPAGDYPISNDKEAGQPIKVTANIERPFQLARYPITMAQFECFIEAPAGGPWWRDLPEKEQQFSPQQFSFSNHPRETVSWYQAVAFCRWLSEQLGDEIALPLEEEWEVAARFNDGRFYPWGNAIDNNRANYNLHIDSTTAVGIYPQGRQSNLGLDDLSGNVFEWCVNNFEDPNDVAINTTVARRVRRGGSWDYLQYYARAAFRNYAHPANRFSSYGFRVVRRPPSQGH